MRLTGEGPFTENRLTRKSNRAEETQTKQKEPNIYQQINRKTAAEKEGHGPPKGTSEGPTINKKNINNNLCPKAGFEKDIEKNKIHLLQASKTKL